MNFQPSWRGFHRFLILVGVTTAFIFTPVVPAGDLEPSSDLIDRVWIHRSQWLDPPPTLTSTGHNAAKFAVFHSNGVFTLVTGEALFVTSEEPSVAPGGREIRVDRGWWSGSCSGDQLEVRYTGISGPLPPNAIAIAPDRMSLEIDGKTYFPGDSHLSHDQYESLVKHYMRAVRPIVEDLEAEGPGA